MGYGVYEDGDRWAGYMVPAPCDFPGCEVKIDRGLAYKCQLHVVWVTDDDEREDEGCGLFFCPDHLYDKHADDIQARPDSLEWVRWMLSDGSWAPWREEHPDRVELMRARVEAES
jgi:hypothetical protein